jgi:hypothetical protein
MYWSDLREFVRQRNEAMFMPAMDGYWKKLDRETLTMGGFRIGQRVKLSTLRGLDQWCGVDRFGTLVKSGPAYQSVIVTDLDNYDAISAKLNTAEANVFNVISNGSKPNWWRRVVFGAGQKQMWHTGWDVTMLGAGLFQLTATIAGTMTE